MYSYKTKGTCSTEITFSIENDIIKEVNFLRGCEGNLQGISRLVEGMNVDDAINKLQGIDCRGKGTSCPDQLAKALINWKENK
ncbi:MAG: TIGR03905 family TSCPD domain-containing protein [Clostridium sp.]|uniref:ribonucleoside-diphosphate reductase n=1 Tax=Clostridium paraputrificum TaxID=29363 RepID=A0A6N2ZFV8_9CLOT|nr:TIGR03905 family TSCPD domain-containing protein [Clostridium sp.]MBS5926907.1 TIGR03905 family TSCPD domain-containing protein [Clostridium sp.]MBS5985099.1 TIGR03905 family TSCPD domain-containing protein [Clostridium sp.]